MEEAHHHHHHHHHHGHQTTQSESESIDQHAETASGISDQQAETISRTSEQQQIVNQSATAPILVPRPNEQTSGGVQATSSFHSVSSIDSSAEMEKYFPDAQTPSLSPFRHHQEEQSQQTQSNITAVTTATNTNTVNSGPYITVPAPTAVQQQRLPQPARPPVIVPQSQQQQQQQQVQLPAASQPLPGIPSYSSQIEGLAVSQTVVNDVLIDLQTKVINETQQQYYNDSSSGNYFEPLSPIYIRAPNPTIILRSDLHRLRAQLTTRPPVVARHAGSVNQFQVPSFPPPQQYIPPGRY